MDFCDQCGNELGRSERFCTDCGADSEVSAKLAKAIRPPARSRGQALMLSSLSQVAAFREVTSRLKWEKGIKFLYDEGRDTFPASSVNANGKVSVDDLFRSMSSALSDKEAGPVVALTARDLEKSGCGSLFGYAARQWGICVVSTARLGNTVEEIAPRLENVIRHELGHLEGLRHCYREGCLMEASIKKEDLDFRSSYSCPQCRRRPLTSGLRVLHGIVAVLLFLGMLVSMNLVATLLEPAPRAPFVFSPVAIDADLPEGAPAAEHRLIFDGASLIESSLVTNPEVAAAELNRLFQLIEPPKLRAAVGNPGDLASVVSGEHEILRIHDPEAPAKAGRIATTLNEILESKGTQSSRCADCHRDRKDEVIYAAAQRQAGFGIGPF